MFQAGLDWDLGWITWSVAIGAEDLRVWQACHHAGLYVFTARRPSTRSWCKQISTSVHLYLLQRIPTHFYLIQYLNAQVSHVPFTYWIWPACHSTALWHIHNPLVQGDRNYPICFPADWKSTWLSRKERCRKRPSTEMKVTFASADADAGIGGRLAKGTDSLHQLLGVDLAKQLTHVANKEPNALISTADYKQSREVIGAGLRGPDSRSTTANANSPPYFYYSLHFTGQVVLWISVFNVGVQPQPMLPHILASSYDSLSSVHPAWFIPNCLLSDKLHTSHRQSVLCSIWHCVLEQMNCPLQGSQLMTRNHQSFVDCIPQG